MKLPRTDQGQFRRWDCALSSIRASKAASSTACTTEDLVELLEIDGEEWLRYKAFPINVAFIRGTTCDPNGNLTMEREALTLDNLAARHGRQELSWFRHRAGRAHRRCRTRSIRAKSRSRAFWSIASSSPSPNNHVQTYGTPYNHAFSGRQRVPLDRIEPMQLDERKIIARRCAFELPLGGVVNLGIGMPEGVAAVAARSGSSNT